MDVAVLQVRRQASLDARQQRRSSQQQRRMEEKALKTVEAGGPKMVPT